MTSKNDPEQFVDIPDYLKEVFIRHSRKKDGLSQHAEFGMLEKSTVDEAKATGSPLSVHYPRKCENPESIEVLMKGLKDLMKLLLPDTSPPHKAGGSSIEDLSKDLRDPGIVDPVPGLHSSVNALLNRLKDVLPLELEPDRYDIEVCDALGIDLDDRPPFDAATLERSLLRILISAIKTGIIIGGRRVPEEYRKDIRDLHAPLKGAKAKSKAKYYVRAVIEVMIKDLSDGRDRSWAQVRKTAAEHDVGNRPLKEVFSAGTINKYFKGKPGFWEWSKEELSEAISGPRYEEFFRTIECQRELRKNGKNTDQPLKEFRMTLKYRYVKDIFEARIKDLSEGRDRSWSYVVLQIAMPKNRDFSVGLINMYFVETPCCWEWSKEELKEAISESRYREFFGAIDCRRKRRENKKDIDQPLKEFRMTLKSREIR